MEETAMHFAVDFAKPVGERASAFKSEECVFGGNVGTRWLSICWCSDSHREMEGRTF